jgi:hypothetical protein
MSTRTFWFGILLPALLPSATSADWRDYGDRFRPRSAKIVWSVQAGSLPKALKRYSVLPAHYSIETVSNLISVAEVKDPRAAFEDLRGALDGKTVRYEEPGTRKFLSFSPESGRIYFYDGRGRAQPKDVIEDVPNRDEAVARTLALLPKFGLTESQFTVGTGSNRFRVSYIEDVYGRRNPELNKMVHTTASQGVFIHRPVNGILFGGVGNFGGVRAEFGVRGRLLEMEISWRNLDKPELVRCGSPEQVVKWIQQGKAVEGTGSFDFTGLREVTITGFTVHYFGERSMSVQRIVEPYLVLSVLGKWDAHSLPFVLFSPLLEK